MSRSVAPDSWNRTCNLSSPRNESGIHGSGGIVGRRKDEMMEMDGFGCGETVCSNEFLRTRASSGGRGTFLALSARRVVDLGATSGPVTPRRLSDRRSSGLGGFCVPTGCGSLSS